MADVFVRLSTVLTSERLEKLRTSFRFAELTEAEQVNLVNLADQEVCRLYNKSGKTDYKVTTSMKVEEGFSS